MSASRTHRGALVLIVDDDAAVRAYLMTAFVREGCVVATAADGEEAIELLQQGTKYDLVLTDTSMPRKGGIEVLEVAQAALPGAHRILMSGSVVQAQALQRAKELGAEIFQKPISLDDIRRVIQSL